MGALKNRRREEYGRLERVSQSVYKVVCPIRELIASVYATGWNSWGFSCTRMGMCGFGFQAA